MIRDTNNRALLNNDLEAFKRFKESKQQLKQFSKLVSEIKTIRETIDHLSEKVKQLEERI